MKVTVEEAVAALQRRAFTTDEGRTVIHTFAGVFGADWNLDGAVAFVRDAARIEWSRHLLGHDLLVVDRDGRRVRFDVSADDAGDDR